MIHQLLSIYFIFNVKGQTDVLNDTWVLYNMMKNVQELTHEYGWFDPNNANPCDWTFVTCNTNDRIIGLGTFYYNYMKIQIEP